MGTDTLTENDPHRVLHAALLNAAPGSTWSAANWHEQATLAHLKSGQIVAAQKRAVTDGYLEPIGEWIDGEWSPNMTRAAHAKADGRWISLYRRTTRLLPGQAAPELAQCPGQVDLLEMVGGA